MSWSNGLIAAALALVVLTLGACGFEPVYGTASAARHAEFRAIEVAPIKNRVGQELRNHLINALGAGHDKARYRLSVELEEQQAEFAIQANDEVTRFKLTLIAQFTLVDLATTTSIYSGTTRSIGSYNVVNSEFATVASERDARTRAAQDLAFNIRERLIIYFSKDDAIAAAPP
jgi:LPS-assembly lipoprotein